MHTLKIMRGRVQPPLSLMQTFELSKIARSDFTRGIGSTSTARLGKPSSQGAYKGSIDPKPDLPPDISDKEAARLKKVEKIKEEIRRGYFYELGQINRTKSKLFEADKELVPPQKALKFPSFQAESLLGVTHQFGALLRQTNNQVSLVGVSFRDSGFRVLPDWIKPFLEEFAQTPAMTVLQVSFEDRSWLKLLKFLLVNGQKASIERERHGQSFLRFGSTQDIREGMGIDNRMVGYVFLVDKLGRMRWRGTGRPSDEEIGSMLKCAHELFEEQASTGKTKRLQGKISTRA